VTAEAPAPAQLALERAAYPHFLTIQTRWMDNDLYGHVNNVVYYSWFDTVINAYLIERGGLDIHRGTVIGYAVESGCRYLRPLAFPDPVEAGLRVGRLGRTSVRYEVGLFVPGAEQASAAGYFVHVFVGRASGEPHPIPERVRVALQEVAMDG